MESPRVVQHRPWTTFELLIHRDLPMNFFKTITVRCKPNFENEFLSAQQQWIEAMQLDAGFCGCSVMRSAEDSSQLLILIGWTDESSYRRWMKDRHDTIAGQIGAERFYESIKTCLFESTQLGNKVVFDG